jgi:hypothetical protein
MGYVLADQIARTPMPDLTGPEKHVLVTMVFYADRDGKNVFCGAKVLAANTSLGQRTVERAIAALRRKGYLVESGWRKRKRVFDIRLDGGCPDTDIPHREDSADIADDDNRLSGGATSAAVAADVRLSDVRSSKESVHESVNNSEAGPGKRDAARDRDVLDEIFTVWRSFEDIRSFDGETVTQTPARDKAIGHALRRDYTVADCEQAIENAHFEYYGENRLVCDLPHCLHADRIEAAIAADFPD